MGIDILLVDPLKPYKEPTRHKLPHIGLGYIASQILTGTDKKVEILDMEVDGRGLEGLREVIEKREPVVVGVTAYTETIPSAHEVARTAKEVDETILTVVGGPHVIAVPEQTLKEFPYFDVAVTGEGEFTIIDILEGVENEKIKGIAYRNDGKIIRNEDRGFITDLDELHSPSWNIFPLHKYGGIWGVSKDYLELPVITGRGCPNQCIFCQRPYGRVVRLRSIESVVDEIEYNYQKFDMRSIYFCDETFTLNKKRTAEICNEIIKRGLNDKIQWTCETRVNTVNLEILELMKKAGCHTVEFGVESGDPKILEVVKKNITVEQALNAFENAKSAGLRTYGNFIFGLPFETRESLNKTINLIRKLNPNHITVGILIPLPGTEVREMAEQGIGGLRIITDDWSSYGKQIGSALQLESLNRKELEDFRTKAYIVHYLRPSRIYEFLEIIDVKKIPYLAIDLLKRRLSNIHL